VGTPLNQVGESGVRSTLERAKRWSTSGRSASLLAVSVMALFSAAKFIQFINWDFDDSYIVYRIADNIIHGYGWVYNVGEPYNPSTSVLNTVLTALAGYLIRDIPLAAHVLASLWILFSGFLLFHLLRKDFGDLISLLGGLGLIILLADGSYWGLETHLFVSISLLIAVLESHGKNVWPVLGLLVLTRPDGLVLAGIVWLKALLKDRTFSWRGLLQFGLVLLPWVLFSLYQFNQVFPDTLAQKVWQGNSGYWGKGDVYLHGLCEHLFSSGYMRLLALAAGTAGVVLAVRRKSPLLSLVIFALIQQIAYVLLNVPAYHWYFSFLDVAAFVMATYAAASAVTLVGERFHLAEPVRRISSDSRVVASGMIGLLILSACSIKYASERKVVDTRNEAYKAAISVVNARYPDGALAAVEVGTIGYGSTRRIVDLAGLVSDNAEFVTGRNNSLFFANPPRIVLMHSPIWPFEGAIYHDFRFNMLYERGQEIDNPRFPMQCYVLREDAGAPTQAEMNAYIQSHYPSFVLVTNMDLANMVRLTEGYCILDTINGGLANVGVTEVPKTVVHLAGWAVDRTQQHVSQDAYIYLVSNTQTAFSIPARRVNRPDVAANLGNDDYLQAGYEAEGAVLDVPSGDYEIRLIQRQGAAYVYCDFGMRLAIQ
jgi:hypothetical protein